MKHKLSIFAILLMALAIPQSVFAYDFLFSRVAPTGQTLYYNINNGGNAEVTYPSCYCTGGSCIYYNNHAKPTGVVRIPDSVTYDGVTFAVTSIRRNAFYECTNIDTLIIPQTVTYIGQNAFYRVPCIQFGDLEGGLWGALSRVTFIQDSLVYGNPNKTFLIGHLEGLSNAVIPYGVTRIMAKSFRYCSTLTSVTIPNSVTTIGDSAFYGCDGLTSVTIPNSVTYIGGSAFQGCYGLTSVTIGNSVSTIAASAFYGCSGLTSVTIPNSVTTIGGTVFGNCSSLATINYNATNCTSIGTLYENNYYSAWPTETVTTLNIGENVLSIPDNAFRGCTRLATINYNATNCTSIGRLDGSTYYYAWPTGAVTTLNIGENVISIPDFAFYNCSGLTSVTIPNSVTSIGRYAFYGCSSLDTINYNATSCTSIGYYVWPTGTVTTLNIGENVLSIPDNVFNDCSGLTSATIPNSVTSIGDYAFYNCGGLTSVTIGNSVISIGRLAFRGCSGLTSITLPNSLDSISYGTFSRCSGLTSISIPSSVASIGNSAFYNCSGLTTISIPDGVTSIGGCAFSGCSGLTNVTIASSVTSIGDSAFAGGDHIIQMTCNAAVPPTVANVNAFDDVFRGIPLYVPAASLSSYRVAYGWREFTNFIGMSTYTITATSNNPAWGTVSGGGSYGNGATATLTAMPNAGYHFVRWQDGNTQNPRTITVTVDATYTAYFEADGGNQGIEDIDEHGISVYATSNQILIHGTAGECINVFSIDGRTVASVPSSSSQVIIPVENAGVYIVKIGNLAARKVVVIR